MGDQESLLFCDKKSDMLRLCKLLNHAASDQSDCGMKYVGLDIFEVACLKKEVRAMFPFQDEGPIFPKGAYFVWWGGERAPQTCDEYLLSLSRQPNNRAPYWKTIFAEYLVPNAVELLDGIVEGKSGIIQENEWIRTFHPDSDNQISLDLVEQL